jgi:hypothetical protein
LVPRLVAVVVHLLVVVDESPGRCGSWERGGVNVGEEEGGDGSLDTDVSKTRDFWVDAGQIEDAPLIMGRPVAPFDIWCVGLGF